MAVKRRRKQFKKVFKTHMLIYRLYERFLQKETPNFRHILDAGCGDGRLIKLISEKLDNDIIGTDFSSNMLQLAREKTSTVVLADCETLPFKNESIDLIFCCEVIEHLNAKKLISEILRILKKNGKFLLTTPNLLLWKLFFLLAKEHRGHEKLYYPWEVDQLLKDNNFKVIERGGGLFASFMRRRPVRYFFFPIKYILPLWFNKKFTAYLFGLHYGLVAKRAKNS